MSSYVVSRTTSIAAEPPRVHGLLVDFRKWRRWSPWEDVDPDLERSYRGPETGVGAHYTWSGNRRAGEGSMVITNETPLEVDVKFDFVRPFSATNQVQFILTPTGGGTKVEWRMEGEQKGLASVLGRFMNMDKVLGKDFEKGLAQLKAEAEQA